MPFRPGTCKYIKEVFNNECQWEIYSEQKGFHNSGRTGDQVHYIITEQELLTRGEDPEKTVPLLVSKHHHVKALGDEMYDEKSSFHPDVAIDFTLYSGWITAEKHLAEIQGRAINYSTSPFADIGSRHRELIERGERVANGDWSTDEYYTRKSRDAMTRYNAEHGCLKPQYKPHPDFDPSKKTGWYTPLLEQFDNSPPYNPDKTHKIIFDSDILSL